MRRLLTLLAATAALAVAPAASAATGLLEQAARSLRSDPVYVSPDAGEHVSPAQERRIENEIAGSRSGPVSIAVLPAAAANEAGGDMTPYWAAPPVFGGYFGGFLPGLLLGGMLGGPFFGSGGGWNGGGGGDFGGGGGDF